MKNVVKKVVAIVCSAVGVTPFNFFGEKPDDED